MAAVAATLAMTSPLCDGRGVRLAATLFWVQKRRPLTGLASAHLPLPPGPCHRPMPQDYPEHRLQFFSLLRAITNHCFRTLFAMSPVGAVRMRGSSAIDCHSWF